MMLKGLEFHVLVVEKGQGRMADIGRCKVCGLVWHVKDGLIQDHYRSIFSVSKGKEKLCPGSGKAPK